MAVLIPTKKIPQLTAYGVPLAGPEMLEISTTGVSRRITTRDFVLPIDSVLTVTPLGVVPNNSRQLTLGIGLTAVDGGPGGTYELNATGAVAGPANPTALVGLAAINGAALTYMRSDAAPALNQGISPSWTGSHTFNNPLLVQGTGPRYDWLETDAAVDNRRWQAAVNGERFLLRTVNDALSVTANFLEVDRTGTVVDQVNLLGTALTWNGSPLLSAATAFANPTASIGLAVVNGAATTAMRSDAAPALDTAISPSWLGLHTFTQPVTISQGTPSLRLNETDAAANNRLWDMVVIGEQLAFRAVNDAISLATSWVTVDRTLNVIDTINLLSTNLQHNGVAISTAVGANPTASVGLAAVNGVATTFMRSDGAPALSQAIAPTWTAKHLFTAVGDFAANTYALSAESTNPYIGFNETDAAVNNRRWAIGVSNEQFGGYLFDDDGSPIAQWITVDRTGAVVDSVGFPSPTLFTSSGGAASTAITISAATPVFAINQTGGAADNRRWDIVPIAEQLQFRATNDAASVANSFMLIDRTGAVVDSVTFPSRVFFTKQFSGPGTSAVLLSSSAPILDFNETDAAANNRLWRQVADSEQYRLEAVNDAETVAGVVFQTDRTGTVVDQVAFPTATANSFRVGGTSPSLTNRQATITSGAVGILGVTQTGVAGNDGIAIHHQATAGDNSFMQFGTEAAFTTRGSISYNRGAGLVAYNTTSDSRRKKNIRNSSDSAGIIDAIQVRAFDWNDSDNHVEHWIIAQELHAVFPMAVTPGGSDADWAVDPSKLIPLVIKELQSVRQRLVALETPGQSERA